MGNLYAPIVIVLVGDSIALLVIVLVIVFMGNSRPLIFGVVLLELLSGRRAVDKSEVGVEQNLVDWAQSYLGDKRKFFRIIDTKLEGQYPKEGAYMVATLSLQCLSNKARMTVVLATLEQLQPQKLSPNAPTRIVENFQSCPTLPIKPTPFSNEFNFLCILIVIPSTISACTLSKEIFHPARVRSSSADYGIVRTKSGLSRSVNFAGVPGPSSARSCAYTTPYEL
ncbi:hypothetical protein L1049_017208 [Liquidambar formosana]|uniref:Uncharacterized protein n=1 Tax=Liquidambar formosana TaxID=63359 RepID=A0AAP0X145_LIQFO